MRSINRHSPSAESQLRGETEKQRGINKTQMTKAVRMINGEVRRSEREGDRDSEDRVRSI